MKVDDRNRPVKMNALIDDDTLAKAIIAERDIGVAMCEKRFAMLSESALRLARNLEALYGN